MGSAVVGLRATEFCAWAMRTVVWTLARVRALRIDVIKPLATTHGVLVQDHRRSFFVEFASAVQALRCATAIQDALRSQTDNLRLRIGVHQGEVAPEGDDLMSDGVIIAARLEPLAEPGGICISARERESGAHLWADRFDGTLEDVFDLQDQVTASVVAAIQPNLVKAEIQRVQRMPTDNLQAYDHHAAHVASLTTHQSVI
jgi:hypothetical protein